MTTFSLVHGAWHGAWCWEALTPGLVEAGHDVVAVDLPCEDPAAGFSDYADVVVASLQGRSEDVVLVGHSLAGQTIPLVAARRPVRSLVYLCALVALPGRSLRQQIQDEPDMFVPGSRDGLERVDGAGTTRWRDSSLARDTFYADCPDDVAQQALSRLRPQATTAYAQPCPLDRLPDVPATYVICSDDRIVNPAWSRRRSAAVADALVELPGGHSPFLSRPDQLRDVLLAVL
jgi:pimeloyl-ACP methyl ester carboxylesterase